MFAVSGTTFHSFFTTGSCAVVSTKVKRWQHEPVEAQIWDIAGRQHLRTLQQSAVPDPLENQHHHPPQFAFDNAFCIGPHWSWDEAGHAILYSSDCIYSINNPTKALLRLGVAGDPDWSLMIRLSQDESVIAAADEYVVRLWCLNDPETE